MRNPKGVMKPVYRVKSISGYVLTVAFSQENESKFMAESFKELTANFYDKVLFGVDFQEKEFKTALKKLKKRLKEFHAVIELKFMKNLPTFAFIKLFDDDHESARLLAEVSREKFAFYPY